MTKFTRWQALKLKAIAGSPRCHNTVHEDFDMMSQWELRHGGQDPIATVPVRSSNSSVADL